MKERLDSGVGPIILPPKSPHLNSHIERFHKSLKSEALNQMILFGENSLRKTISAFLIHYHSERNHQGLNNKLIDPGKKVSRESGKIVSYERLGGLLRYYYRKAA